MRLLAPQLGHLEYIIRFFRCTCTATQRLTLLLVLLLGNISMLTLAKRLALSKDQAMLVGCRHKPKQTRSAPWVPVAKSDAYLQWVCQNALRSDAAGSMQATCGSHQTGEGHECWQAQLPMLPAATLLPC